MGGVSSLVSNGIGISITMSSQPTALPKQTVRVRSREQRDNSSSAVTIPVVLVSAATNEANALELSPPPPSNAECFPSTEN
jgi:hypothetical protein